MGGIFRDPEELLANLEENKETLKRYTSKFALGRPSPESQIGEISRGVSRSTNKISEQAESVDINGEYLKAMKAQEAEIQATLASLKEEESKPIKPRPRWSSGMTSEFIPNFDIESDLDTAVEAFAAIESRGSGDYEALGPIIKSGMYKGDRAYGRYQVMGDNVPKWTKKYLGKSITKEEFLKDPKAQDAVIQGFFRENYAKFGTVEDVVSKWFTGQPLKKAEDRNASDGNSTVNEYVGKFRREFYKVKEG
jgi:hypothetical protein